MELAVHMKSKQTEKVSERVRWWFFFFPFLSWSPELDRALPWRASSEEVWSRAEWRRRMEIRLKVWRTGRKTAHISYRKPQTNVFYLLMSNHPNLRAVECLEVMLREEKKETQPPLFSLTACLKCKSLSSFLCLPPERRICRSVAQRHAGFIYLSISR